MGGCWEVGKRDRGEEQACWMGKRQLDARCLAWDRSWWLYFGWAECAMNIVTWTACLLPNLPSMPINDLVFIYDSP